MILDCIKFWSLRNKTDSIWNLFYVMVTQLWYDMVVSLKNVWYMLSILVIQLFYIKFTQTSLDIIGIGSLSSFVTTCGGRLVSTLLPKCVLSYSDLCLMYPMRYRTSDPSMGIVWTLFNFHMQSCAPRLSFSQITALATSSFRGDHLLFYIAHTQRC